MVDVNPGGHRPWCCSAAGLVLGPPGLADPKPTWPQFCSLFLSLKPPMPFRHQMELWPGSVFPISFPYDGLFAQVASSEEGDEERGMQTPFALQAGRVGYASDYPTWAWECFLPNKSQSWGLAATLTVDHLREKMQISLLHGLFKMQEKLSHRNIEVL